MAERGIDALESALGERPAGRLGVAEAQEGMKTAMLAAVTALRTLDIVIANTLEDDPALFEAWKRVRRVVNGQSKAVSDAAAEPTTPSTVGETVDPLAKAS